MISGNAVNDSVGQSKIRFAVITGSKDALLETRQARVQVWSFLATGDASYRKAMTEAFTKAKTKADQVLATANLPEGQRLIRELQGSISMFQDKAEKAADLKASGIAVGSPQMSAALDELNTTAKQYAVAASALTEFYDKAVATAAADVDGTVSQSIWVALVVGTAATSLTMLTAWLIGRGIAGPVAAMTKAMNALADGDKTTVIPRVAHRDEVAEMAKAVQVFKDNAIRADHLAEQQKIDQAAREARTKTIDGLTGRFDNSVSEVLNIVASAATELEATAQSMSANALQTNNQAGRATDETSTQIAAVQQATEEAVAAIRGIVGRIDEINQIAGAVAAAVEQQSAATAEIARNVQEAAAGTQSVSDNIACVTEAAAGTGEAAGNVLSAAQSLAMKSTDLRKLVGGFLSDVRAA